MKILALITGMTSGGAERVMATLCNEFSVNNEVVLGILKDNKTDYKISKKVKIVSGNIKNKNLIKSVKFVINIIRNEKPDVILSFMTKTNIVALIAKKILKQKYPIIISERANPYNTHGILCVLRKFLYPNADGCVFQTKWAKDYYNNILKCDSRVIINPLASEFKVTPYNGKRRKVIVCTARLSEEKNQEFLIRTFSKITNKYQDYTLEIYGDGPNRDRLENLIFKLNLDKKVKLMGRKRNIIDYIKDAELFVLPSNSEGMPNALIEAMALGIPCIATDCPIGGPADIIENNKNGILIEMNNQEELINAISRIIDDKSFQIKLSTNSVKIIDRFETKKVCNSWEKYIKEIVVKHKEQ